MAARTFYKREHCEIYAARLLVRYQKRTGERVAPPIDVAVIGELDCGLTWDWAEIPEADGEIIWARLLPNAMRVELNELHAVDLSDNRGLDRFTHAHEIGHWELHAEHPKPDQLHLFALDSVQEVVVCRKDDNPWVEHQANWFAAALLMPEDLFRAAAVGLNLSLPSDCSRLRRQFDVSWQALSIRVNTLGLGPLPEGWDG